MLNVVSGTVCTFECGRTAFCVSGGCACDCSAFLGVPLPVPFKSELFERISTPVVMSNPQADRVRDIAKLRTRATRTKKYQFLVEDRRLCVRR